MEKILTALLIALSVPAYAQTPTIVYGASSTAAGQKDQFTVIQPENGGNPLGDPLYVPPPADSNQNLQKPSQEQQPQNQTEDNQKDDAPENLQDVINQSAAQNPAPFSESPEQQQNQIQNTLYQGGNRIYDIQSFPLKDIKTITEPNIQPTITTYPEY